MTTDTHQQLMLEKVKCEEGEVLRFPMLSEPCGCFDSLIALKCRPCSREEWKTLDGTAHVDACDRCHSGRIPVRTLEAVWDAAECQGWTVRELRKVVKGEVEKPVPLDGGQAECPRCQFRFRLSKNNHKEVR